MSDQKIMADVKKIIKDVLHLTKEVKVEHKFKEDLKADEIDMLEIVLACEGFYEVDLPDDKIDFEKPSGVKTVSELIVLIEKITKGNW